MAKVNQPIKPRPSVVNTGSEEDKFWRDLEDRNTKELQNCIEKSLSTASDRPFNY